MKHARQLLLAASALAFFVSACSQAPADLAAPLEPQFGTPETDSGNDVTVDLAGRVYVVGATDGDLARRDLGGQDAFIRRYARGDQASVLWQRQFGTAKDDSAFSVATGPNSEVYVVGRTSGSLAANNTGFSEDAFIRKYTRDGAVVWTRQFGGTGTQAARAVAVDAQGSVYILGEAQRGAASDVFVRKYTASGSLIWHKQFGEEANDESAGGIAATGSGVFVTGSSISYSGDQEEAAGFLRKLTAAGAEQWTRTINLGGDEYARDVAVGGGVYVTGSVATVGTDTTTADGFLRKYDENGRVVWTRQFGSQFSDSSEGVSVDPGGSIYIAGSTFGVLADFNSGSYDVFAQKYTSAGEMVWTRQYQVSTYSTSTSHCSNP